MGFSALPILVNMNRNNLLLILFVVMATLSARLLPHSPNFSPLASLIIFSAAYYPQKKFLVWPFLALFFSDIVIGFYAWPIMLSVYGSLALTAAIGFSLKNRVNFFNVLSASLGSALLFFLITNGAVWYFGDWYSPDLAGLGLAYALAVPFFKNTVMSNLFYTTLLFSAYEFWLYRQKYSQKKLALPK